MRSDQPPDSFFEIDLYNLDLECQKQPKIFYEHAITLADARQDYERAKSQRDVIEAELDRDMRLNPETYDLAKITEPALAKAILLEGRYQKANELVIISKHSMDIAQAAVDALDHKKYAIQKA